MNSAIGAALPGQPLPPACACGRSRARRPRSRGCVVTISRSAVARRPHVLVAHAGQHLLADRLQLRLRRRAEADDRLGVRRCRSRPCASRSRLGAPGSARVERHDLRPRLGQQVARLISSTISRRPRRLRSARFPRHGPTLPFGLTVARTPSRCSRSRSTSISMSRFAAVVEEELVPCVPKFLLEVVEQRLVLRPRPAVSRVRLQMSANFTVASRAPSR